MEAKLSITVSILCDASLTSYRDIKQKNDVWKQIAKIVGAVGGTSENDCPVGAEYVKYVLNTSRPRTTD